MITQYGVLPYRATADGGIEILLVTSKERGRWVIPKGNPIPFMLNHESAAREAFEEAGVEGPIASEPIGAYRYGKRRRGAEALAEVCVYPLQVTREAAAWPEHRERIGAGHDGRRMRFEQLEEIARAGQQALKPGEHRT